MPLPAPRASLLPHNAPSRPLGHFIGFRRTEKWAVEIQGATNLHVPEHLEYVLERLPGRPSGLASQIHCNSSKSGDQMFLIDRRRPPEFQGADEPAFGKGDHQSHRLGEVISGRSQQSTTFPFVSLVHSSTN
jgi:hypothetical protein